MEIRFDEVARSERYYTSTILPFLLLSNSYQLLYKLFSKIYMCDIEYKKTDDIEIVTELDPLRDSSINNEKIKEIYRKEKRIAVPDLFLRINNIIIVIEAKFFTFPDKDEINDQITLQMKAINLIKPYTSYSNCDIIFLALTIEELNFTNDIKSITWNDIINLLEINNNDSGYVYYLEILKNAINRAKKANENKNTDYSYERITFMELLDNCNKYIKEGKVFVGFSGGLLELEKMSLEDMTNRSHYKISKSCISNNWISIDKILGKYIELKYKKQILDD